MIINAFRIWTLTSLLLLSFNVSLISQCVVTNRTPIVDNDTTQISILVQGLTKSDLASDLQGLCAVQVQFRHQVLGDISATLFSPSGDSVILIGEAVTASSSTDFTRWNVTFVACDLEASPDPGFSDVWLNDQDWGIFGNYTGQYYPFTGCLEDFNTGTANGTWTLRVTDISPFDSGEVSGIQLIFCDQEGQECKACLLDPGITTTDTISVCKTATEINAPESSYNLYKQDTSFFKYSWAIFKDSLLINIHEEGQWFSQEKGLYKVCGFQYAKGDSLKLPNTPILGNSLTLNAKFEDSLLCAMVSDTCFYVSVIDSPPDTIEITKFLCNDQPVLFKDSVYTVPGEYIVIATQGGCDSIFKLQVLPSALEVAIILDTSFYPSDTLGCQIHGTKLYTDIKGQTTSLQNISWYTNDGFIQSTFDQDTILVRTKGTYYAIIQDGYCRDTSSYVIFENDDDPEILADGNFLLNCDTDTAMISVITTLPFDSIKWFSYYPFDTLHNQLITSEPGNFLVEVFFENGCVGAKRIDIDTLYTKPLFVLEGDTLQCEKDTAFLQLLHIALDTVNVFWTGVIEETSEILNAKTAEAGWKLVEITHLFSACTVVDSFYVEDERDYPSVEVYTDTITCINQEIIPEVYADDNLLEFEWTGPGLFSTEKDVVIAEGGIFTLKATNSLGCSVSQSFEVLQDTTKPFIILERIGQLDCDTKEVILQAQVSDSTIQYFWTEDYLPNPILVNEPGKYIIRATSTINGCKDSLIAEVFQNESFAKYDVQIIPMNCTRDSALIEIVPRESFDQIEWSASNPVVFSSGSLNVATATEGVYYFNVISDGDCIIEDSLTIGKDTLRPSPSAVIVSNINCVSDTASIVISWFDNPVNYQWTGQSLVFNDINQAFTTSAGVIGLSVTGSNGCKFDTLFNITLDTLQPAFEIYYDALNCFYPEGIAVIALETDIDIARWILPDGTTLDGWDITYQQTGLFSVIVSGLNGCISNKTFEVTGDFDLPEFSLQDTYLLGCQEGSIPVSLSIEDEVSEIKWISTEGFSSVQNTVDISQEGSYSVIVTGINGCIDSSSFTVEKVTDTVTFVLFLDTITCLQPQIQLKVETNDDDSVIEWKTSDGTLLSGREITVSEGGIHTIVIKPQKLCPDSVTFEVIQDTILPEFTIVQNGDLVCGNTFSELSFKPEKPGKTYSALWSTIRGQILDDQTKAVVSIDGPGIYRIKVQDLSNGCINEDSINIMQLGNNLTRADILVGQPLCKNDELGKISLSGLDGTAPYNITLNGKDLGQQTDFSDLQPGNYMIVIKDSLGCTLDTFIKMFEAPDLSIGLEDSYKVQFGDTLFWQPDLSDFNGWNFNITLLERGQPICEDTCSLPLKISPSRNTIYEIVVTPSNAACSFRQRILVTVDESLFSGIPNILSFSATQTNNDVFYIPQKRGIANIKAMRIFDTWGSPIFFREDFPPGDPQYGWNGTIMGKNAEIGVYFVVIDFELTDGRTLRYSGDVTLIP